MGSDMDLTKLRSTLDEVTEEFFDTLELFYQTQAKLESLMRDGFLSMSRARYSMGGTRSIGALQFSKNEMEMEALALVDVTTHDGSSSKSDNDSFTDEDNEDSWTAAEYTLFEKQPGKLQKIDRKNSTEKSDELRQRKGKGSVGEKDENSVETVGMKVFKSTNEEDVKQNSSLKDPLTLFGVLVSPHLRQCQASFKQAVAVSVDIANLKHKLQGLRHTFKRLKTQKEALVALKEA